MALHDKKIGFCLTGSFCTIKAALTKMDELVKNGAVVTPIMSFCVDTLDTRFYKAQDLKDDIKIITKQEVIRSITEAEPIGPKKLFDLLIVAPCTGNTMAKLACGIADTPVTMAVKSHLRNGAPVLIGVSTNDGLANAAKNIGQLLNTKNIYFIPYGQDAPTEKEKSLICDFSQLMPAAEAAIAGKQLQPVLCCVTDIS